VARGALLPPLLLILTIRIMAAVVVAIVLHRIHRFRCFTIANANAEKNKNDARRLRKKSQTNHITNHTTNHMTIFALPVVWITLWDGAYILWDGAWSHWGVC